MNYTALISAHSDHKWAKRGRCVYCVDCGDRLYQGDLPGHRQQKAFTEDLDKILDEARATVKAKVQKEWDERTPEQIAAWNEGRASYVKGDTVMDRMRRGNPHKNTPLAKWFNLGWQNAEFDNFKETSSE